MLPLFGRKLLSRATNSLLVPSNENVGRIGCGVVTASSDFFSQQRLMSNKSEVQKLGSFTKPILRIAQLDRPKVNHYSSMQKIKTSSFLAPLYYPTPLAANFVTVSKHDYDEFVATFPDIVQELSQLAKQNGCDGTVKSFENCLQYNVASSPLYHGISTVVAFQAIANPDIITPENLKLARYLGWCIEMLGGTLLILDDIMDGGETRRGRPCWYKLDNVKMAGINDAFLIETGIYLILKKFFSHTSYYVKLIELFHEASFILGIGESLDLQSANISVDDFTMERLEAIAINKTGFYIFYLPLRLAMHMAEYSDPVDFNQLKQVALEMAKFFQIQDDFLDCFGDPKKTGKHGSDIQNGKCTWLSVVCMQRANEAQKNIMRENYGQNHPQKVALIKKLYEDLELPKAYAMYEQESFIPNLPSNKISKIYQDIFDHLWKKTDLFM